MGVWEFLNIPAYLGNTVVITVGSIVIDVVLASLCAYPLACMRFPGRDVIMVLLIAAMIIPAAAGMVINYLTLSKLHLLNTLVGVILPGSLKVFSIVLLRQAYLGVPRDLIEAARIDGASELLIWRKIMILDLAGHLHGGDLRLHRALERVPVAGHRPAGPSQVPAGRGAAVPQRFL